MSYTNYEVIIESENMYFDYLSDIRSDDTDCDYCTAFMFA